MYIDSHTLNIRRKLRKEAEDALKRDDQLNFEMNLDPDYTTVRKCKIVIVDGRPTREYTQYNRDVIETERWHETYALYFRNEGRYRSCKKYNLGSERGSKWDRAWSRQYKANLIEVDRNKIEIEEFLEDDKEMRICANKVQVLMVE